MSNRIEDSQGRIQCTKCLDWKYKDSFLTLKRKGKSGQVWQFKSGSCNQCRYSTAKATGYHQHYQKNNREKISRYGREYRARVRKACLAAYGGVCSCCGESQQEFLTIDHINGRTGKKRQVHAEMVTLKQQGNPKHIQILCFNCNCAKGIYGSCPHSWEAGETKLPLSVEQRREVYEAESDV